MKRLSAYMKAYSIILVLILLASCSSSKYVPVVDSSVASRQEIPAGGRYVVQKGDTLYGIAFRYQLNFHRLGAANGLKPPYIIYPGDVLRLTEKASTNKTTKPEKVKNNAGKVPTKQVEIEKLKDVNFYQDNGDWLWPVKGKIIRTFSSGDLSKGIDIVAAIGTPVRSTRAGKVVYAGDSLKGYGNLIIIRHDDEYLSAYAHNRVILVKEGQQIKQGQTIAELGMSGTQSPKLHFEIRKKGRPIDPLKLLNNK